MRKSILMAILGAALPTYMSDPTMPAVASPIPTGDASGGGNSTENAGISAAPVPDADHTPEQRAAAWEAMGNVAGGTSSGEQSTAAASAEGAQAGVSAGEAGNAGASQASQSASSSSSQDSAAGAVGGDAPNAVLGAAAPSPSAEGSAMSAAGAATSSLIAGNSAAELPLHVRLAQHLEAIYQLAKEDVEKPVRSLSQEAVELKAHIADTLHKLHNGIAVSEGVLVQKLEAILRLL
ncbi:hypothetical protein AB1286_20140 [Trinickia sp. NRRL B-1857]|uniref:hypothetical protein n=1 Tax=Trinickia sp. NRRL B-1857 TaxID=3162879 RepID=UPI003D28E10E